MLIGPAIPETMISTMYVPAFVLPLTRAGRVGSDTLAKGFAAARNSSDGTPPPSGFDGLMSTTTAKAKLVWAPVPG